MKNILYFIIISLFLSSCKKEPEDVPVNEQIAERFDVSDAKGLAIFKKYDEFVLSKLSFENKFSPVKILDTEGALLRKVFGYKCHFDHIYRIDENYAVITGQFKFAMSSGGMYSLLVDLNTGQFYGCDHSLLNPVMDENKNIYNSYRGYITKTNYSNPTDLKTEDYVLHDYFQNTFKVDKSGNILYSDDDLWTYRTVENKDVNILTSAQHEVHISWLGNDGFIRYIEEDKDAKVYFLYKISNENGIFLKEEIGQVDYHTSANSTNFYGITDSYVVDLGSKTYFISKELNFMNYVYDKEQQNITILDLPELHSERKVSQNSDYVYIEDGTLLYKIAKNETAYTFMLDENSIDISTFGVTKENDLFMSGLRYSDGENVFAKIDESNQLTIINDSLGYNETLIEYININ